MTSADEKLEVVLDLMENHGFKEEYSDFKARVDRAKEIIKEYRKKYGTIAVVAHYHTIEWMRAKTFTQDGNVQDYQGVLNCQPYFENIDDLLKQ